MRISRSKFCGIGTLATWNGKRPTEVHESVSSVGCTRGQVIAVSDLTRSGVDERVEVALVICERAFGNAAREPTVDGWCIDKRVMDPCPTGLILSEVASPTGNL